MGEAVLRLAAKMGLDEVALTPLKISQKERDKASGEGWALPDGSFPVDTREKFNRAIQAFGRAPEEHRAALKKLLLRAAKHYGVGPDVVQKIGSLGNGS